MKMNRLAAMLLGLCMALQPLAFACAEEQPAHDASAEAFVQEAPQSAIILEGGEALPERYTVGDALRVALSDGEPASWQYAIDYIGYSETFSVGEQNYSADACDAGTAAVRALKGWRISDDAPISLRISALDSSKNVLHETEIPLDLSSARIVQINGLPLPQEMRYGQLLTLAVSNGEKITRWQYKLSAADGTSLATTTSSGTDVAKTLTGCVQSALRWGSVDLSQPLTLNIAGFDAESVQATNQAAIRVSFISSSLLAENGAAIPGFVSEDALLGRDDALTLRTVSGEEGVFTLLAYDKNGVCIGEEVTQPCASKTLSYSTLTMVKDRYCRHIDRIEVTVTENGEVSAPVVLYKGYGCPACGEETTKKNAHYVRNCGHYRCDGYDHRQADCHQEGHCNAYHVAHTMACSACRVRLCSEEGYNPENCHACEHCGKMLCITQDLDHTPCEGCGNCMWYTNGGKHESCEYCGLYFCTYEGRSIHHDVLVCGEHARCSMGGIYHKRGDCGVAGHYTCDGQDHAACPTCKLYACSEEYAYLDHEPCEICGMRHCNKNYTWAAHQICAHCGDWLCKPGTDHRPHPCGVEGHYRCDGKWHNTELIDKYCDATPQHRKCEGNPEHYCDPEDGGCGQTYPCSQSNRHTICTMCGLHWCDRSNGGHETPCGIRSHRPCQLSGYKRSQHVDCEYCGQPKCVGSHANCGQPFTCDKCWAKFYQPWDHTRPCGHLVCAKGDHSECPECGGYYCDTSVHVPDPEDESIIICLAPKADDADKSAE